MTMFANFSVSISLITTKYQFFSNWNFFAELLSWFQPEFESFSEDSPTPKICLKTFLYLQNFKYGQGRNQGTKRLESAYRYRTREIFVLPCDLYFVSLFILFLGSNVINAVSIFTLWRKLSHHVSYKSDIKNLFGILVNFYPFRIPKTMSDAFYLPSQDMH